MKCNSIANSLDFDEILAATHSSNPTLRKMALREFCPCHVRKDFDIVWARVLEMITDEDENVREQVVHSLCDGSPRHREEDVIAALESLWNDPSEKIKRKVRRVLTEYRRSGAWNVL
eukprot:TRINITY_DN23888_c0_g1_i1.p1 TRINITY_DN23888_c0_g1~~TRINITY_DN23888_c0_g1_i1.p1  ORF type:complete len:117 (-),score=14.93 TRINITY_DN23888_c0_g1_i1:72-422(-)